MKEYLASNCAELNLPGVKLEVVDLSTGVPEPQSIKPISVVSTRNLHEELVKREGVEEIVLSVEGNAVFQINEPDHRYGKIISGPCRILINHD